MAARTETATPASFEFYDHVLEYRLRTGKTPGATPVWQILVPARAPEGVAP
jgi:hypothetical protein